MFLTFIPDLLRPLRRASRTEKKSLKQIAARKENSICDGKQFQDKEDELGVNYDSIYHGQQTH